MFYHKDSKTHVREGESFTLNEIQYPATWWHTATASDKLQLGLEEVVTVGSREDDRYFYVSENLVGNKLQIVNTPKPAEQIAQMENAKIQSEIFSLESNSLMPRVLREFLLSQFQAEAIQKGVDPSTILGYVKVKALDDQIAVLRAKLQPLPPTL